MDFATELFRPPGGINTNMYLFVFTQIQVHVMIMKRNHTELRSMKKYEAVYESLREKIDGQMYRYGEKLPTEQELMKEYAVSRQTVRNALAKLKEDGYAVSVQGSGYTVSVKVNPAQLKTIAVITTYISRSIFPYVLTGIEKTATENGYSIIIRSTGNSIQKETQILQSLMNSAPLSGVIVEGTHSALPNINSQYYEQLASQGVPVLFINGAYASLLEKNLPNLRFVFMDDYNGGYNAVRMLFRNGHKKIAGIFKSDDMQGIKRYEGFSRAVFDYKLEYDDRNILWVTSEDFTVNQQFLDRISSGCTAVVSYCDDLSIQIAQYVRKNPTSLTEVISFDRDTYIHLKEGMRFFSYGYQKDYLGVLAAKKMINMIRKKEETSELLPWLE